MISSSETVWCCQSALEKQLKSQPKTTFCENLKGIDKIQSIQPLSKDDFFIWFCDVDEFQVRPDDGERWKLLLSLLTQEEKAKVLRFHQQNDRHHSLLSIQMQRALVRKYLDIVDDKSYEIRRSAESKPFARLCSGNDDWGSGNGSGSGSGSVSRSSSSSCSNGAKNYRPFGKWNYNVSHHGRYVAIASHSHLAIGIDLMTLRLANNRKPTSTTSNLVSTAKYHQQQQEGKEEDEEEEEFSTPASEYMHIFKDQFTSHELDRCNNPSYSEKKNINNFI